MKGAEVSGRWRPVPAFTMSGSMAYLDFEWTKYNGQCYFGRTPDAGTNCNYDGFTNQLEIGRASCRERVFSSV